MDRYFTTKKKIRWYAGTFLSIVVLSFIIKILFSYWKKIPWKELTFSPLYLLFSIFMYLISAFLVINAWRYILLSLGEKIKMKNAIEIYSFSMFGRYIPGKVWMFVGRVALAKDKGKSTIKTSFSILIENAFLLFTSLFYLFAFLLTIKSGEGGKYTYFFFLLLPLLLVLYPPLFSKSVYFLSRIFKFEPFLWKLKPREYFRIFFLFLLSWGIQTMGFSAMVFSFYQKITPYTLSGLLTTYPTAWIVGFLSFIFPGGLGVREGALIFLLKPFLPFPIAVVSALLSRIWTTASELIWLGIVILLKKTI